MAKQRSAKAKKATGPGRKPKKSAAQAESFDLASAQLSNAEKALIKRAKGIYERGTQQEISTAYELGECVVMATTDARYGEGTVEKMATILRVKTNLLYRNQRLAEFYTPDHIDEVLKLRSPSNAVLTRTHLDYGLHLGDVNKAMAALRRAAGEGWTTDQMRNHVYELVPPAAAKQRASAARVTVPNNFQQQLQQLLEMVPKWLTRAKLWTDEKGGLFGLLQELPSAQHQPAWLQRVEQVHAMATEVRNVFDTLVDQMAEADALLQRGGGTPAATTPLALGDDEVFAPDGDSDN